MRIMLTVYKDKEKTPFDKIHLNAEDETDITLAAQDLETYLFSAYNEIQEGEL